MSPDRRPFLTAEWRDLVMLNYCVDPAVLAPHVPAGTVLDLWHGDALVSMVGFRFLGTRIRGIPIPLHRDFDEVNLRFYVRAERRDEVRRGVVFIREIVPRRVIALVARLAYNEPYIALPMKSHVPPPHPRNPRTVRYSWRGRTGRGHLQVESEAGEPSLPGERSEETFITEHYWGYTRQRDGGTIEYRVDHPRWRTWNVTRAELACDAAPLYGPGFAEVLAGPPSSAMLAEGSPVTVHAPERLAATRTHPSLRGT